jgi:hypothetical protein
MAKQEFDTMTLKESKEFMEMVQRELKEMRKLIEDCKEQLIVVNKNRPFIVQ